MKRTFYIFALVVFVFYMRAQQDPQYNLYQFNQMVINPAYAGARDGLAVIASSRKQWVGFEGAPQTSCFSAHAPVLRRNIGLGLTLVNDVIGPRSVSSAYLNFAYILKLKPKLKLSLGINAGYNRYQFKYSQINLKNGEPQLTAALKDQNTGAFDFNSGVFLRSPGAFIGLSVTHLNTATIYNYKNDTTGKKIAYYLKNHVFLTVGRSFIINNNLVFAPTLLLKTVNNNYGFDVNLNCFVLKKVWLGAFYRYGYGPGALMQYYITNKFRIAYSYDSGISDATRLGGSHEIMIGFDLSIGGPQSKTINPRFL